MLPVLIFPKGNTKKAPDFRFLKIIRFRWIVVLLEISAEIVTSGQDLRF